MNPSKQFLKVYQIKNIKNRQSLKLRPVPNEAWYAPVYSVAVNPAKRTMIMVRTTFMKYLYVLIVSFGAYKSAKFFSFPSVSGSSPMKLLPDRNLRRRGVVK